MASARLTKRAAPLVFQPSAAGRILPKREGQEPPPVYLARVLAELRRRFPGAELGARAVDQLRAHITKQWQVSQSAARAAQTLHSCDGETLTTGPPIDAEAPAVRAPAGARRGQSFGVEEVRPALPPRPAAKRAATPPRVHADCPPGTPACGLGLLGGVCGLPAVLVLAGARGSPVPHSARYCLTSAGKLVASHLPTRGFAENPAYPEDVQERAYDRNKSEQLKVLGAAQNLIPELIFNGGAGALDGLPVATSKGIVLGGNGRTMALQVHYHDGGTAARDYLLSHSKMFGFSRANVAAVPDPVVVRVIDTAAPTNPRYRRELQELVRLLNVPLMELIDVRSESVAEARRITDEVLDVLSVGLGDQSLREYLSTSKAATLASALRRAGILTDRNTSRLLAPDGSFSEDGKTFTERVLLGALIPDARLLDAMDGAIRASLARATPWLLAAASAGQDWDLRPALLAAVEDLTDLQRRGVPSVEAFLRQTTLGMPPAVLGVPQGVEVLRLLADIGRKPLAVSRFAQEYAAQARQHPTAQQGLFAAEKLSPAQAFAQAARGKS